MTRKSSHADQKLIEQGRKLLISKGASSLSIRELTSIADVNLGMFSYHFKNKENFIQIILDGIYEDFLSELNLEVDGDDLEVLRRQLLVIAKFARDNRCLILSLLSDVLDEETVVQEFVKNKMRKHFGILAKTLKSCQEHNLIIEAPLPLLVTQIIGSVGLSNLVPELLKRLGVEKAFNKKLVSVTKVLTSDEVLKQRIDILLKGIVK